MSEEWELRKLKSIEQIVEENTEGDWTRPYDEDDICDWEYTNGRTIWWHINDEMLKNFGDGRYHKFRRIATIGLQHNHYDDSYTHECDDTYIYNKSWFEIDRILKLDDKDFLL